MYIKLMVQFNIANYLVDIILYTRLRFGSSNIINHTSSHPHMMDEFKSNHIIVQYNPYYL